MADEAPQRECDHAGVQEPPAADADEAETIEPATAHDHGARILVDGSLAITVGLLSVVQSRINGELALRVGNGLEAAMLSFGGGLLLIAVIVAVVPSARHGVGRLRAGLRPPRPSLRRWMLLGGIGGATFVASQGLVVPVTGVALFTVAIVAGLTGNSLVADRLGVGPGGRRPVTGPRVVAAVISVAGVAVAVSGELGGDLTTGEAAWLLLALLAGGLVAIQQGLNGRVAVAAGSPLTAALVNFIVGFTALLLLGGLTDAIGGAGFTAPPAPWSEPLLWLGGPIGVAFVGIASWVVRGLGVLLFSLLTIIGQLGGGVLVDLIDPVPGGPAVIWQTWAAVGMAIAAGVLAFLGSRPATGRMKT